MMYNLIARNFEGELDGPSGCMHSLISLALLLKLPPYLKHNLSHMRGRGLYTYVGYITTRRCFMLTYM